MVFGPQSYLSSLSFLSASLVVLMLPEVFGLSGAGGLTNRRDAYDFQISVLILENVRNVLGGREDEPPSENPHPPHWRTENRRL